jgi:hypothetical protein
LVAELAAVAGTADRVSAQTTAPTPAATAKPALLNGRCCMIQ